MIIIDALKGSPTRTIYDRERIEKAAVKRERKRQKRLHNAQHAEAEKKNVL